MTKSDDDIIQLRSFFIAVLMLSSIGLVATDSYIPSLPFIQSELSTTKGLAKLTLSMYLLSFSTSQLYYGQLSDKIGRRKTALLGLTLSLFGSLVCVFSLNIYSLITGRFLQGLGLGAGATLARTIRRDVHSGNDLARFGSYIIIGTSILFAAAPAIGGYIQHYLGWRMNFLFILLYTLFGIYCVWAWLPETNKSLNPLATKLRVIIHNYLVLVKSPIYFGYCLCSSLAFAGLTAYFTSSPFLFETQLGLTPIEYGRLGLFIAGGLGAGGFFNKFNVKAHGRHTMLATGISVIFLSGILMYVLAYLNLIKVISIMIPMFFYSFGAALTFTNSVAGAFQRFPHIAGFAGAMFGSMQIFGGAFASGLMILIDEKNQIPLSLILIAIGIIAYIFQRRAIRFEKALK